MTRFRQQLASLLVISLLIHVAALGIFSSWVVMRALREEREDVERQIATAALGSPGPLPPYLFKPEVVQRFRKRLKATLGDSETGVAREYLRRLVDRIVISDGDVVVEGNASAAAALMAESRSGPAVSTTATKVRTHVVGWRPRHESNV